MTKIKLLIFLFPIASIWVSCKPKSIKPSEVKLISRHLGKSDYTISILNTYKIEEKNGPDFTVYYISPFDSTVNDIGSAGIYFGGHPQKIRPRSDVKLIKDSSLNRPFLDSSTTWTIYDYGSDISAETILSQGDYSKTHAFVNSKTYSGLDSLIQMLSSLAIAK